MKEVREQRRGIVRWFIVAYVAASYPLNFLLLPHVSARVPFWEWMCGCNKLMTLLLSPISMPVVAATAFLDLLFSNMFRQ